eukprot:1235198-Pyramimonas_sp.AAC.1
MGIATPPLSLSCEGHALYCVHRLRTLVPTMSLLYLGSIPKTSTVSDGSAAKPCAARAYDWKVKPSSAIFCTRSPK